MTNTESKFIQIAVTDETTSALDEAGNVWHFLIHLGQWAQQPMARSSLNWDEAWRANLAIANRQR